MWEKNVIIFLFKKKSVLLVVWCFEVFLSFGVGFLGKHLLGDLRAFSLVQHNHCRPDLHFSMCWLYLAASYP